MNRGVLVWLGVLALSGCETSSPASAQFSAKSLPEYAAHQSCLAAQAERYARAEGSPLELGIIGSSACSGSRYRLGEAITNAKNRYYAEGYIGAAEREEPKMVAAAIIKLRG